MLFSNFSSAFFLDEFFSDFGKQFYSSNDLGIVGLENGSFSDPTGDVINMFDYDVVDSSEYLDIKDIDATEVSYNVTGQLVEFSITVDGQILDRGSLDDVDMLYGNGMPDQDWWIIDSAFYCFNIETDFDYYRLLYVNGSIATYGYYAEPEISNLSSVVDGSTLNMFFEFNTESEEIISISVDSSYCNININLSNVANMTEEEIEESIFFASDFVPNPPLEILYIDVDSYVIQINESIEFRGAVYPSSGQPPYSYFWEFGDGSTAYGSSVNHSYTSAGRYLFTLTVTDSANDTCSASGYLRVVSKPFADFTWTPVQGHVGELIYFTSTCYDLDGEVVECTWDFGDGIWGLKQNTTHTYTSPGVFTVRLNVTDDDGFWTVVEKDIVILNEAPMKPSMPVGEASGSVNESYWYSTSSSDPEGDIMFFAWDFGDGSYSEWIGPCTADEVCRVEHSWSSEGDFHVRVKAKDVFGYESEWSEPLPVSMPREVVNPWRVLFLSVFEWFVSCWEQWFSFCVS